METFYRMPRINAFFGVSMALLTLLTLVGVYDSATPQWKTYQKEFYRLLTERRNKLKTDPAFVQQYKAAQAKVEAAKSRMDEERVEELRAKLDEANAAYQKTLAQLRDVTQELEKTKIELDYFVEDEELKQAKEVYEEAKTAFAERAADLPLDIVWYREPDIYLSYKEAKGHYDKLRFKRSKTAGRSREPLEKKRDALEKKQKELQALFDNQVEKERAEIQEELAALTKEYDEAQKELAQLSQLLGDESESFAIEVKQIHIEELDIIDRCVTCHLGYNMKIMDDGVVPGAPPVPQPFRYHPPLSDDLADHPFEQIGCTTCHEGQGIATKVTAAHGKVKHWDYPMLPKGMTQLNCFQCHTYKEAPKGTEMAQKGYKLFSTLGCVACHKIEGLSAGVQCPELTNEGDKHPKLYTFGHIYGEHSTINWQVQHFLEPERVSPGTAMPRLVTTYEDALALATFVLSLKTPKVPSSLMLRPPDTASLFQAEASPVAPAAPASSAPAPAEGGEGSADAGKALFDKNGCIACHKIAGKGGTVAPDLTGVSQRLSDEDLFKRLKDPQQVKPGSVMPTFGFSDQQIRDLIAYLKTL